MRRQSSTSVNKNQCLMSRTHWGGPTSFDFRVILELQEPRVWFVLCEMRSGTIPCEE